MPSGRQALPSPSALPSVGRPTISLAGCQASRPVDVGVVGLLRSMSQPQEGLPQCPTAVALAESLQPPFLYAVQSSYARLGLVMDGVVPQGLALQAFERSASGLHDLQHESSCQAFWCWTGILATGQNMCLEPSLDETLDGQAAHLLLAHVPGLSPAAGGSLAESRAIVVVVETCHALRIANNQQVCAPPSCAHARPERAVCSASSTHHRRRRPARARCGVAACAHAPGQSDGRGRPGRPQMLPPPPHSTLQHKMVTLAGVKQHVGRHTSKQQPWAARWLHTLSLEQILHSHPCPALTTMPFPQARDHKQLLAAAKRCMTPCLSSPTTQAHCAAAHDQHLSLS